MYNYSGIIYRIWGVCGIILLLGIVLILFEKPWSRDFTIKKCKLGLIILAVSICASLFYISRLIFPTVSSYTGEFVEYSRNSRVAPPLPLTNEYVFYNGEGEKRKFYLDIYSKEKIFQHEFETGNKYTIYFDEITNIIVKVDVIEQTGG